MSLIARQSTALELAIGPVLDADGVAVTGCVVADFKLKKTTGNFAALNGSATLTHVSAGIYDLVLTTSDTDTVGLCCVAIDDTVNACASVYLQVIEEAVYDILFAASATGAVPVASIAAGAITAAAIATDAIDADALAADAIAEINATVDTAISDAALATAASLSTVAGFLDTEIAAILADTNELQTDWVDGGRLDLILDARASQASVDDLPTNAELATSQAAADDATLAAIAALNNLSAAQVNAEVDTALADIHLDHLLATTYDPASKPGAADALLNELVEDDGGVARYTANALEQGPTGGSAPTVGQIADEVQTRTIAAVTTVNGLAANTVTASALAADAVVEIQSGLATASALATAQASIDDVPTNAELATALGTADDAVLAQVALVKAKTDNLPSDPADQSLIIAATDALVTLINDVPTNAELATALAAADDAVLAAIAALNNLSAAQINAEVVDALATDTYAEPTGPPAATASLKDKIGWLAILARNKVTQSATEQKVRNDADSADIATATVSDTGSVFTRGEYV